MKSFLLILSTGLITFGFIAFLFFRDHGPTFEKYVHFQTKDGNFQFTVMPSKGRDVAMMERYFHTYKDKMGLPDDLMVYRATPINYLNIKKWTVYKYRPEWQYKYLWWH